MRKRLKSYKASVGSIINCPHYKDVTKEEGITLVALIITIIVLIILAAVTIFAFTESGLLKTASKGTENYANAQEYEKQIMNNIDEKAKDVVKNITDIQGKGVGENPGEEEPPAPLDPELQEGWEETKVYAYKSEDNVIVPVPKEFAVSEIESEKSVSTGLVIYEIPESEREGIDWEADADNDTFPDVQERYNQFVWVPVANTSEMFGTAINEAETDPAKKEYSLGKLYSFSSTGASPNNWIETTNADEKKIMSWLSNTGYRDPDIVTSYDGTDATSNASYFKEVISSTMKGAQFKTELQKEFNDMKASVEKYNGFYMGRYETGNLLQNKAVVTKGNSDIANQNWYVQYKKSKTVVEGKSSMIWGCQWDAVMRWFLSSTDEETRTYVTNSTGAGNYSGGKIPTGSNDEYSVNNIYDMAGNIYDWTLEANDTISRVVRRRLLQQ